MKKLLMLAGLALACLAATCNPPRPPDPPVPTPTPTVSPTSPPGREPVQSLRVHPTAPHCLELNGEPWLPYAYGGVVTVFGDAHPWRADIDLCIAQGCDYLRHWAMLGGEDEWPWLKVGAKWDLSRQNPVFWARVREVNAATRAAGIVVEHMIYDRGLGGSVGDYRAYPWHPDNNINGLQGELPDGGAGVPEFYQARPGGKLLALQELYEGWWVEAARDCPNCILEVENEHRSNAIDFARRVAQRIKALNPRQLTSYSTLGEDLRKAYDVAAIDIVNPHFGSDGNDPDVLDAFCRDHWALGITNVDEFANGLGDPRVAMEQAKRLEAAGCGFHFEDAKSSAKPELAAAAARATSAARAQHACIVGPTGPGPVCPKETARGASFYRADWRDGSCTGHDACRKQNAVGFPAGVLVAFDSTPRSDDRPLPGNCPAVRTVWSISPPNPMRTTPGEDYAMQSKFVSARTWNVCADGPAAATCIAVQVRP